MPSTYTSSLRLTLPATGELNGTWGDVVNDQITSMIEQAIAGFESVAMADANKTLSTANGASDESRNMIVELTGALTAARDVIVPTAEKLYLIKNSTTGGFALTVKTAAGTGISVANGRMAMLFCDGTNVLDTVSQVASMYVANNAGIGVAPSSNYGLDILSGAATSAVRITNTGGGHALVVEDQASPDTTAPFVVGPTGRIGVGIDPTTGPAPAGRAIQILSSASQSSGIQATNITGNAQGTTLEFNKARTAVFPTPTAAASGDEVFALEGYAYDGTSYVQVAEISTEIQGTVSTGVAPGKIIFNVAAQTTGTLTEVANISRAGDFKLTTTTGVLGYGSGSGGTVVQATSKSTAVTLNRPTGLIVMHAAALAANTSVTFTFNNTCLDSPDMLIVLHVEAGTAGAYTITAFVTGVGTADITVRNVTAGSLSQGIYLQFAVLGSQVA
jgi:hypothetical protein